MKNFLLFFGCLVMPVTVFAQDQQPVVQQGLYAYETSAGMKVGAVFGEIPDVGQNDDLVDVSAPSICDHAEIHQMKEVDGIMQMRAVPEIAVKEGQADILSADGYHVMLMKLASPLKVGQKFPLTLTFKKAGKKVLDVPVIARSPAR